MSGVFIKTMAHFGLDVPVKLKIESINGFGDVLDRLYVKYISDDSKIPFTIPAGRSLRISTVPMKKSDPDEECDVNTDEDLVDCAPIDYAWDASFAVTTTQDMYLAIQPQTYYGNVGSVIEFKRYVGKTTIDVVAMSGITTELPVKPITVAVPEGARKCPNLVLDLKDSSGRGWFVPGTRRLYSEYIVAKTFAQKSPEVVARGTLTKQCASDVPLYQESIQLHLAPSNANEAYRLYAPMLDDFVHLDSHSWSITDGTNRIIGEDRGYFNFVIKSDCMFDTTSYNYVRNVGNSIIGYQQSLQGASALSLSSWEPAISGEGVTGLPNWVTAAPLGVAVGFLLNKFVLSKLARA